MNDLAPPAPPTPEGPEDPQVLALEALVERLWRFGSSLQLEWLDGALTALAVGPVQQPIGQWLLPLLGEEFERAYPDPASVAEAEQVLGARLATLRRQLDPDRLLDFPSQMWLDPLLYDFIEPDPGEAHAPEASEDAAGPAVSPKPGVDLDPASLTPEQLQDFADAEFLRAVRQGGAFWADGFLHTASLCEPIWGQPRGDALDELSALMQPIAALRWPTAGEPDAAQAQAQAAAAPDSPRALAIGLALSAVQDLRLFWLDHPPRAAPRRVAASPGRNDPCPCGSGKKFKKCHG